MARNKIDPKLQEWIAARKRHRLSHAHTQMARELGLDPAKLGKIDNHRQEPWKAPLPEFIEYLYEERFGKTRPDRVMTIEQIAEARERKKSDRREARRIRRLEQDGSPDNPAVDAPAAAPEAGLADGEGADTGLGGEPGARDRSPAAGIHLLTVEDRFRVAGRGLVLVPHVTSEVFAEVASGWTTPVHLRRPDGTERLVEATFWLEHFRPGGYRWMCWPKGLSKDEIPVGTEVWLERSARTPGESDAS